MLRLISLQPIHDVWLRGAQGQGLCYRSPERSFSLSLGLVTDWNLHTFWKCMRRRPIMTERVREIMICIRSIHCSIQRGWEKLKDGRQLRKGCIADSDGPVCVFRWPDVVSAKVISQNASSDGDDYQVGQSSLTGNHRGQKKSR